MADHHPLVPTLRANSLLPRAGHKKFHSTKICRQGLASRMLALTRPFRSRQRFPFTLGVHFLDADTGFQFQQLQLFIAEFFAARAVLGKACPPQRSEDARADGSPP